MPSHRSHAAYAQDRNSARLSAVPATVQSGIYLRPTQPGGSASLRGSSAAFRPLALWHLFSLDAPTVAALWAWSLARALQIHLPPMAPALLALGTWLIYVADRLLDGWAPRSFKDLRERHLFYARHRLAFLSSGVAATVFLFWMVLFRMRPAVRHDDLLLFAAAALYFVLVHSRAATVRRWMPKELCVGILFAAATAVPAWARTTGTHSALAVLTAVFALLCWLNCIAIEKWEGARGPQRIEIASYLRRACWLVGAMATLIALYYLTAGANERSDLNPANGAAALSAAGACSALLLGWLDSRAPRMSTLMLRVAADLALLTPLPLLLLWR